MSMLRDIFWPENIIRIRFLPFVIVKVISGVLLAPAVVFCAGHFSFIIEPAWPRILGRCIIPFFIVILALTVYLMMRFVVMLTADVFTVKKLIIRYQIPVRRGIMWKDISSIEIHHRKNFIALNTDKGKRFELKGFRGTGVGDRKIINDDYLERSSYEYRFHGLNTGITIHEYITKLRRFIPEEMIIEM